MIYFYINSIEMTLWNNIFNDIKRSSPYFANWNKLCSIFMYRKWKCLFSHTLTTIVWPFFCLYKFVYTHTHTYTRIYTHTHVGFSSGSVVKKLPAMQDLQETRVWSLGQKDPGKTKLLVFPVVMYRCESWTRKKAEGRRIDAFELWCWRRLFRVPWTTRSNKSILKEISPE